MHDLLTPAANLPALPSLQILVGNKSDVAEGKRAVPYAVGKALADEYRIHFFETSAKENTNVEEVRGVDGMFGVLGG